VLIVGAGIAGPTLAYWLLRAGHEPTLVERAPQLRQGGYLIDFWGAGFEVAERMGIAGELRRLGYRFTAARAVGVDGRRVGSFETSTVLGSGDRYVSIARSDLAAVIFDALDGRVELMLDETVRSLEDHGDRVRVSFERHEQRDFDLVVGTDGLHSQVRRLAFGPEEWFEKYLGIVVAVFDVEGYRPRDELVAMMHAEVGFQVVRVALRDDVTMFALTVRHEGNAPIESVAEQQELLRRRLAGARWETPPILEAMQRARTFYFDRVSQIRMPSWSRGRVALVGDAAACPSLLAGQGSALAMVEAYVLAAELARSNGDHVDAFARYQQRLAPFLRAKQDAAKGLGLAFAPRNRFELSVRNTVIRLMGIRLVAKLAMGRSFRDAVELPVFPPA
jgi:2-polyprenyl-6-methoxyphenol hydroxylase-like FAD-dependent oxidoreductase